MKEFLKLKKLNKGDKVAILSPSFAAPGQWPHIYELGLSRIIKEFDLVPVEYPTTKKIGATGQERANDLISAFENNDIKAIISTLGGDDEVTYVKNIPNEPFVKNPKPFFGYSDTTHIQNFLWLNGIPSYYGGALFTQFAMQNKMDELTKKYLKLAFFENKEVDLEASPIFNDEGLNWDDKENLNKSRKYEGNDGWYWDGSINSKGILWGGCLESLDELLRHNISMPSIEDFKDIILIFETSEEIPSANYVNRVLRALGERGFLENVKGMLVGRPKSWEFDNQKTPEEKELYKSIQRDVVLKVIRKYNFACPVVQNVDFGHTDPQICLPLGLIMKIDSGKKTLTTKF